MNEINLSLFSGRLKDARKELGISQSEAADLVGISREHWGRCERGLGMPGGEVLAALANAGADVRYILTGRRDFDPPPRLTAEEETMLEYFKDAPKGARRAALAALLGAAPGSGAGGTHSSSGTGAVHMGQVTGVGVQAEKTKKRE